MKIDIPPEVIDDLRELLVVLGHAAEQHKDLHQDEVLIDPWRPSNTDQDVNCPDLTVELLRKVERIRKLLRL